MGSPQLGVNEKGTMLRSRLDRIGNGVPFDVPPPSDTRGFACRRLILLDMLELDGKAGPATHTSFDAHQPRKGVLSRFSANGAVSGFVA